MEKTLMGELAKLKLRTVLNTGIPEEDGPEVVSVIHVFKGKRVVRVQCMSSDQYEISEGTAFYGLFTLPVLAANKIASVLG